jgi:cyclophilin family peptidyl-prolyl cis-trans isomerase
VPSNKQRRQAAQRRLQRQLERRAELARKRRRNVLIGVTAAAVVLVVATVLLITGIGSDDTDPAAAEPTPPSSAPASSAAAPTTNADGTVACTYTPDDSGNPDLEDVGTPPNPDATPTQGTSTLLMSTDQGDLTLTLDRAKAPCAAASFTYLAQQSFFDGSPCHRLVNQPGFGVLQCGDPTGSGSGGPSYKYAEEVTPETTYPRGTIAMAKTPAPNTTGSQFFLCFVDTELPPEYTVVGSVDEAGLAVLDKVAAGGIAGVGPEGDGAPSTPVTIETMTVVS